ncbi:MAG TPA: PQQ-binding-like beta-propeller repeat protein [Fimbriimonas sp.]
MARAPCRLPRLLACLAAGLAFASAEPAEPLEWPEWRGGLEGRAVAAPPPGPWQVVWKTPVPGEGHSSPIVSGSDVYVTTAREVPEPRPLLNAILGAVGATLGTASFLGAFRAGRFADMRRIGFRLRAALVLFLLILAMAIAAFGASLLHFRAAPERGWFAGGVFAISILGACALAGAPRVPALLAAVAVALAATIPDAAHTVLLDPKSSVSLFIYATVLWPVLLAWGWLRATRGRPWLLGAAAVLPFVFALWVAAFEPGSPKVYTSDPYVPNTDAAGMGAALAFALATLAYDRLYPSRATALLTAAAMLGALAFGAVFLGEHALSWSPYLNYLSMGVAPESVFPRSLLAAVAAALAAGFALGYRRPRVRLRGATKLLAGLAAVSSVLYFAYALFVPKWPHLERAVVCVDRASGRIRWISPGLPGERGEMHEANSPATPTAATDGHRIYAYFGTPGLLCVDRKGREVWRSGPLPFESREGPSSSPILVGDRLILLSESDTGRWIAAYDAASGRQAWRTERSAKTHPYAGNCRSPVAIDVGGLREVLVWGYEDLAAYDSQSGTERWSYRLGTFGRDTNPVVTPTAEKGRLYLVGPSRVACIDIARLGEEKAPILWDRQVTDGAECSSPVAFGGRLFAVSDYGTATCVDGASGRNVWERPLRQQHYASALVFDRLLYLASTRGRISVLDLEGNVLEKHELGDGVYASPAAIPEGLLVRSRKYLWLIRP